MFRSEQVLGYIIHPFFLHSLGQIKIMAKLIAKRRLFEELSAYIYNYDPAYLYYRFVFVTPRNLHVSITS